MAKSKIEPESLLPLTPAVFHVLLALADGERHGYAIMQEVTASTDGQIKMGPGTLYGTVKRLLEAELIEESDDRPDAKLDDERRRYYRLTGVGERVVRAEAQRYAAIVAHARGKKLIGKAARLSWMQSLISTPHELLFPLPNIPLPFPVPENRQRNVRQGKKTRPLLVREGKRESIRAPRLWPLGRMLQKVSA